MSLLESSAVDDGDSVSISTLGFYDELGRIDLQQRKTPTDISAWASRLQEALPPVGVGCEFHR